ncbi:MAG: helix-turn-helix transcriptional regulator [Oscillospiraceae bacterium]|nr:helix-turn-helix transcriptional regulator [Oscillospiraceae bacterium]
MISIGEFIKNKRTELGLSQKKLGVMVGLSDSEIMKIENGTRKTPNWESLCKLAGVFEISPLEILLISGYITDDDINPQIKIKGLEKLSDEDLKNVQQYIDFIISRKDNQTQEEK